MPNNLHQKCETSASLIPMQDFSLMNFLPQKCFLPKSGPPTSCCRPFFFKENLPKKKKKTATRNSRPYQRDYGQWLFLVPLIGGRWYIITQLATYTTYIPLLYCQLGDYISPIPPIRGTRNNYWYGGALYIDSHDFKKIRQVIRSKWPNLTPWP